LVPGGEPVNDKGGDLFSPSHVYVAGMGCWWRSVGEEITRAMDQPCDPLPCAATVGRSAETYWAGCPGLITLAAIGSRAAALCPLPPVPGVPPVDTSPPLPGVPPVDASPPLPVPSPHRTEVRTSTGMSQSYVSSQVWLAFTHEMVSMVSSGASDRYVWHSEMHSLKSPGPPPHAPAIAKLTIPQNSPPRNGLGPAMIPLVSRDTPSPPSTPSPSWTVGQQKSQRGRGFRRLGRIDGAGRRASLPSSTTEPAPNLARQLTPIPPPPWLLDEPE